jgi:hypothetical protein
MLLSKVRAQFVTIRWGIGLGKKYPVDETAGLRPRAARKSKSRFCAKSGASAKIYNVMPCARQKCGRMLAKRQMRNPLNAPLDKLQRRAFTERSNNSPAAQSRFPVGPACIRQRFGKLFSPPLAEAQASRS